MNQGFHLEWQYALNALPYLIEGIKYTVFISVCALIVGCLIGSVFGIGRCSKNKIIYSITTLYVEVIRGTPLMVQSLYIYFALPMMLNTKIDPIVAGVITISINAGAYISEIVRGSIQTIEKGQFEAGRSLGLTSMQTLYHVIWPQAFKRMIPALGNQFIISLKDTSLLAAIGVAELTRQGTIVVSSNFRAVEIYTLVAVLYLVLTLTISAGLKVLERKLHV